MGLDMYAFTIPADKVGDAQVDIKKFEGFEPVELFYWRKHHDLHGWMSQLYQRKGGTSNTFNCDTVRLMPEDLDELEIAVKANKLPMTFGFFFGNNPPDAESITQDLEFIAKAREAIAAGNAVLYDSWW